MKEDGEQSNLKYLVYCLNINCHGIKFTILNLILSSFSLFYKLRKTWEYLVKSCTVVITFIQSRCKRNILNHLIQCS